MNALPLTSLKNRSIEIINKLVHNTSSHSAIIRIANTICHRIPLREEFLHGGRERPPHAWWKHPISTWPFRDMP